MESESLAGFYSAALGGGPPSRLTVFEDGVEVNRHTGVLSNSRQRVRFEQVAQVSVLRGFLFSDVVVETRGGGRLTASGFSRKDAEAARKLIMEQTEARHAAPPGPSRSANERLRELADLKDSGLITPEEFEAQRIRIIEGV